MVQLDQIIKHIRNREYMSGVDRDKARVKATGEIFTKEWLVRASLDKIEQFDPAAFLDLTNTFCDNASGDGNLISEVLIRKLESVAVNNEVTEDQFEQALQTIYGVDLMPDNVDLCRERLLGGQTQFRHIVEQNIVCADALRYHYRFDGSPPYDDETQAKQKEDQLNIFVSFE
jgi:hypothetical protein